MIVEPFLEGDAYHVIPDDEVDFHVPTTDCACSPQLAENYVRGIGRAMWFQHNPMTFPEAWNEGS